MPPDSQMRGRLCNPNDVVIMRIEEVVVRLHRLLQTRHTGVMLGRKCDGTGQVRIMLCDQLAQEWQQIRSQRAYVSRVWR